MGFLPNAIEWEIDKWFDTFMNGSNDDSLQSFIKETNLRLLDRASWNDDADVNALKDVTIHDVFHEHINESGLVTSMVDVYDEDDVLYGNVADLEEVFNNVRDTLWKNGVIQKVYEEHQDYGENEIFYFIAENYKNWI